jgi:AraC-like DNA-binding protein
VRHQRFGRFSFVDIVRARFDVMPVGLTRTTIAAVARRYGFSDMSSFSRAFRAE